MKKPPSIGFINRARNVTFTCLAILCLCLLPTAHAYAASPPDGLVVNINTASLTELQKLPGVGPSKAAKIITYRTHRPFRTAAEMVRIKGFGPKTVSKLLPHISVRDPAPPPALPDAAGDAQTTVPQDATSPSRAAKQPLRNSRAHRATERATKTEEKQKPCHCPCEH